MHILLELWLPIVVSAAFAFVASFIIHMALPWHRSDFRRLPDEEGFRAAVRPLAVPPGDYLVPRPADPKDMNSPEFARKRSEGPVVVMTVRPNGAMSMSRSLALWFLYLLVVSYFAAYVSGHALHPGASYRHVFRFAGLASFLGYSLALWQNSIWWGRSWAATLRANIDGIIYAGLTAGTFGWLWPHM